MTDQDRNRAVLRWIGFLLLCAMFPGHAADEAVPRASSHSAIATTDAAISADWQALLDHGDSEAIYATYTLIDALKDDSNTIEATRCAAHAAEIEEALKVNPVGLALWLAAQECAEANNDSVAAGERLARFEALLRHAFASRPDDNGKTPIRIIGRLDADAVVEASGHKLLYAYYDNFENPRHLTLFMGVWDASVKRERLLTFDYLDTVVRLHRDDHGIAYPMFRKMLGRALLHNSAQDEPHTTAGYADALNQLMELPTLKERLEGMGRAAAEGNFPAAMALVHVCLALPAQACDEKSIDGLLPFAEKRFAPALVLLAAAYSSGSDALRDDKAARSLLDAADTRLGDRRGRILFTAMAMVRPQPFRIWPLVRKELEQAAAEGDPAALLLVVGANAKISGKPIPDSDMKRLLQIADEGFPAAQYIYGLALAEKGQIQDAAKWMELAASADFTLAQSWLGNALYTGKQLPRDVDRALSWLARAGHGGDTKAMVTIGKHHLAGDDTTTARRLAEGWLGSAAYAGSVDGALALATLYESGDAGLDGSVSDAALIYEDLAERRDNAAARRRWALLLRSGKGVAVDRAKAETLLRGDAQKGDGAAQRTLAALLFDDASRKAEAMEWLRKASAGGDTEASNDLAYALWYGRGGAPDPVAAVRLWQTLVEQGHANSANNYAWALCTGSDSTAIDGIRGMGLLQALGDPRELWAGAIDTLAACHAAAGNFTAAALTQQHAIDIFAKRNTSEQFRSLLSARLAAYTNGMRHIDAGMIGN